MLRFLFFDNRLILFDSLSDCTNFYSSAELLITTRTATNEVNAEIETQPVIVEAKISNCST